MSLPASVAAWQAPDRRSGTRHVAKVSFAILAAAILSQYLAACFFLWSVGLPMRLAKPLTVAQFAYYYGDRPSIRRKLLLSSAAGLALTVGCGALAFFPGPRKLHGDARFARRLEIAEAGLLGEHGIILGRVGRRCLMLAGQQGVALAAPPRSGKGTGVVIPNALNWPGSLVCVDIKRENWTITAGYRQASGQACYLLDFFAEDARTARWNPFAYVSPDRHRRVNDLQRIAEMLYPDPPNVDPFWTASARSLFLGIALYLFETRSLPKTIGEVLRQGMASDDEGFGAHWRRVIEGRNSGRFPLSAECVRALYDVIDLAPVTASSIRKTFTSRLDLWLNPILDAATAANDFDLRELRIRPMSIYVAANPDDLHRLRPVLNLFFQQAIGLQTRELPEQNPRLKHQVMMLLDEFASMGRIPIIAEAISYLPGYNVRLVLVFHAPAQLREVYGVHNAETMLKSLAARIVFAAKDIADAQEISNELGFMTIKVKTLSRPLMDFDSRSRRSRSVSISEQRRALLLPQEVKELGNEEAIVFYEGLRPIRCRKIRYFSDARFRKRLLPPPTQTAPEMPPSTPATVPVIRSPESDANGLAAAAPASLSDHPRGDAQATEEHDVRDATVADIERLDTLALDDFAVDLSKLEFPDHGGPLSEAEMAKAVVSFLNTLER